MLIYICDDTENDRLRLEHNLKTYREALQNNYCIDVFSITLFASGEELLSAFQKASEKPDLIFLDIYMTGANGIEAAERLRTRGYAGDIVFTTSSREHAMASYDVNALYYLQKPYTHEQFLHVMGRCHNLFSSADRCFHGMIRKQEYRIPFHEILYFEISGHSVILHMKDEDISFRLAMWQVIDQTVNVPCFFPCGKSYLINLNYVEKCIDTTLIMSTDACIPIPYRIKNEVTAAVTLWKKRKS